MKLRTYGWAALALGLLVSGVHLVRAEGRTGPLFGGISIGIGIAVLATSRRR